MEQLTKKISLGIMVILFFHACIVDVNPKLPRNNSVVLNGLIVPGDSITVSLFRSATGTDTSEFEIVENVEVTLLVGSEKTVPFSYLGNGVYRADEVASELTRYKVIIITLEDEEIWAETITPEIKFGAVLTSAITSGSFDNTKSITLTISDNPDFKNFYWITDLQYNITPDSVSSRNICPALYTNSEYADMFNETYDPSGYGKYFFEYNSFMHFQDFAFSGETIAIEFMPVQNGSVKQDSIIVFNFDEHYSNYLKSKLIYEQGGERISSNAPPINYIPSFIYSNVHNGLGILGSYTAVSKCFRYE